MPILKSPPKVAKNETLQLRVEEEIKMKLRSYAEFLNSSESYVVSEALKLLFRKDSDFTRGTGVDPSGAGRLRGRDPPNHQLH